MGKKRPDIYGQVARNIRSIAAQNGDSNSVVQISRRVCIPQSTLHDKLRDPRKFTLEDLQKISVGFDTEIENIVRVTR